MLMLLFTFQKHNAMVKALTLMCGSLQEKRRSSSTLYPYRQHPLKPLQCRAAGTRPPPPAEVPLEPPILQLMWQTCCSSCTHSKNAPEDVTHTQYTRHKHIHIQNITYWSLCSKWYSGESFRFSGFLLFGPNIWSLINVMHVFPHWWKQFLFALRCHSSCQACYPLVTFRTQPVKSIGEPLVTERSFWEKDSSLQSYSV